MKQLIFLIIAVLVISNVQGQILPIEDIKSIVFDDDKVLADNITYIKDVNNKLNKFVGTWKGDFSNKSYEFKIEKYTKTYSLDPIKEDILIIRYEISTATGEVIESALNLSVDNPLVIKGYYLNTDTSYVLNYVGKNGGCGQRGQISISVKDNKMYLLLVPLGDVINMRNCPNGIVGQVLPTSHITLTK